MLRNGSGLVAIVVAALVFSVGGASGTTPGFPPLILAVSPHGGETEPFGGGCPWQATAALRGTVFLSLCRPGFFEGKGPYQIAISRTPFRTTTVIAEDDALLGEPTISPDGRWVAFDSFPQPGASNVELVRMDGTGRHLLAAGYDSPSWAGGSKRLLATNDATGKLDVIDLSGRRRSFAAGRSPVWQPHGRLIAYVGPGGRLVVSKASGGARRVFGPAQQDTLAWSPDGRTLAYVSDRGVHGLLTWDARTGKRHLLARYLSSRPAWSPDGRRLAIIAAPNITSFVGIYAVGRNGKSLQEVFFPGGHSLLGVSWLSDGRLVFELA